jgi:lysozyme
MLSLLGGKHMIRGADYSHYNGIVDWAKEKSIGIDFCFLKATEGNAMKDSRFDFNVIAAPKAGILTGAYCFFHPKIDPVDQASFFVKAAGQAKAFCMDWETTDGLRASVNKASALVFLQTVESLTKKVPFIYGSPGFLAALGDLRAFEKYPLWVAEYGVTSPRAVAPWWKYTFWQYSDSNGRDLNSFAGTQEELNAFFT